MYAQLDMPIDVYDYRGVVRTIEEGTVCRIVSLYDDTVDLATVDGHVMNVEYDDATPLDDVLYDAASWFGYDAR